MRWLAAFEPDTDPDTPTLTGELVLAMLANAEAVLRRRALISDASRREIDEARSLDADLAKAVAGARAAFDVITAHRAGGCDLPSLRVNVGRGVVDGPR